MKKSVAILFSIFAYLISNSQQHPVFGVVSIHNSATKTGKKDYVSNAQIEELNGKAQPTITDNFGRFKLTVIGLSFGDSIIIKVAKPSSGLEVVNIGSLNVIVGRKDTLRISMAPKGMIADFRKEIYKVGLTSAEKRYRERLKQKKEEIAILKSENSNKTLQIEVLRSEIEEIQKVQLKLKEIVDEISKYYSNVNLDEESDVFKRAFNDFTLGNLDGAMEILGLTNIPTTVSEVLETDSLLRIRFAVNEKRRENAKKNAQLKADLFFLKSQFDSSLVYYNSLIRLDSNNIDYWYRYSTLHSVVGSDEKSIKYYLKTLDLIYQGSMDDSDKINKAASVSLNLGNAYQNIGDTGKAFQYKKEALRLYELQAIGEGCFVKGDFGMALNNMGTFYRLIGDTTNAITYFKKAISVFEGLQGGGSNYEAALAICQTNLANLYRSKGDFEGAKALYLKSIKVAKVLIQNKVNIDENEKLLGSVITDLAILHQRNNMFNEAESLFNEASLVLSKLNGANNLHELAYLKINFAQLYSSFKLPKSAIKIYQECFTICKDLAYENPTIYFPWIELIQNNLTILYSNSDELKGVKNFNYDIINSFSELAKEKSVSYNLLIAQSYRFIARAASIEKLKSESIVAYKNSLEYYSLNEKASDSRLYLEKAGVLAELGDLYYQAKEFLNAVGEYRKSYLIYCDLYAKGKIENTDSLNKVLTFLTYSYRELEDTTQTEKILREHSEYLNRLVHKDSWRFKYEYFKFQYLWTRYFITNKNLEKTAHVISITLNSSFLGECEGSNPCDSILFLIQKLEGEVALMSDEFDKAILLFNELLSNFSKWKLDDISRLKNLASINLSLSFSYFQKGNTAESKDYGLKSLELFNRCNDLKGIEQAKRHLELIK